MVNGTGFIALVIALEITSLFSRLNRQFSQADSFSYFLAVQGEMSLIVIMLGALAVVIRAAGLRCHTAMSMIMADTGT